MRIWLAVLWACFVARGAFYACVLPLWEGFDEYSHFARIEYLASEGREPARDTPVPRDVADSLAHLPAHDVGLSFDEYWKRTDAERAAGIALPKATIYEAQQPPVFYWLFAGLYRLGVAWSLGGRVVWLRLVCVLVASAAVPLGYLIGRNVCGSPERGLCAAALIVLLPLPYYTATHVSNECLAIALGSFVMWLALRHSGWGMGVALGAALLTKAYFLAFLPPVVLLLFTRARGKAACALAAATVVSGWWYGHNWAATGSLTGHNVLVGSNFGKVIHAVPRFPLRTSLDFGWTTFIWTGNWSFLGVRGWMYHAMGVLLLIPFCGVGILLWRRRAYVRLLAAFLVSFALACVYLGLGSFAAGASPGASGWYACSVMAAFAVLLVVGMETVLPRRWMFAGLGIVGLAFAAMDLFGTFFYSLPYYTGLISHSPGGALPAYTLQGYVGGGAVTMFRRLGLGKPAELNMPVMVLLCTISLVSVLTAILASIRFSAMQEHGIAKSSRTPSCDDGKLPIG